MEKIPRIGVGVFVFRDGKFLIGQRKGSHGEDAWSIPGGHLEFGESPEQTAEREVEEETGLKIKNIRFGGITNDVFPKEDKHYITIWMLSDWESGEAEIIEPDYYVQQCWCTFEDLPQPLFLPWNQLLTSPFFELIKKEAHKTRTI